MQEQVMKGRINKLLRTIKIKDLEMEQLREEIKELIDEKERLALNADKDKGGHKHRKETAGSGI